MCGIAGFSLSPTSKVNARSLAHELLSAIETRGSDSSGFGYVDRSDGTGVYKNAVPGSQLPLTELPRRASTVILHTRYATQGKASDNRNNHPVLSPDGNVALVHNGVISNDWEFRQNAGGEFSGLPPVDTAVIPAMIERYGLLESVGKLEGYAAVAYIDARDDIKNTMHLARLDYSPVHFTWLLDGSFVFASTQPLLAGALANAHLDHGHIFEMPEETYMAIRGGIIMTSKDGYTMQEDWRARARFGNATAGGHASANTTSYGSGSGYGGIGSSFGQVVFDDEPPFDGDLDHPGYEYNPVTKLYDRVDADDFWSDKDEVAMAFGPELNEPRVVFRSTEDGITETVEDPADVDEDLQGFYVTLEDGSMEYFNTIDDVENGLAWISNLQLWDDAPFPEAEKKLNWTNFVIDMGEIRVKGGLMSWLEDMGKIDIHENPNIFNLNYVREGLGNVLVHRAV